MHEVLVNHLEGLSLPRKSVVRLTDRPDMTLHAYRGYKNNNTTKRNKNNYQRYWNIFKKKSTLKGPVVQSIVSLTKSLGEYPLSLSVLTKSTATIIFC